MGVYDYLKGSCPNCGRVIGENSGDIQIKWFSQPDFRSFFLGERLPEEFPDGLYPLEECLDCKSMLYAVVKEHHFQGFTISPEELPTWNPDWDHRHTMEELANMSREECLTVDRTELIKKAKRRAEARREQLLNQGQYKPFPG